MTLSELCIRRPVMTVLLSVALVAAGLFAYRLLPVAALPRVDFPVINVSASLPGASPETMAASVATPLEREFSRISGIELITSSSDLGSTSITLQFALSRDIDDAAADVQAALARASRVLPEEMPAPPSYFKVNPADQPVLILALTSKTLPLATLDDYAETLIAPRIATLPGVAEMRNFGSQKYALRIYADPDALAARGIGLNEIERALAAEVANTPVGSLSGPTQQMTLVTDEAKPRAEAFGNLIVASRNGVPVYLREVATVVDSVENDRTGAFFNGVRTIMLAIMRQPNANTVAVVDHVRRALPEIAADLPPSVTLHVANDRSRSIREAVADVQFTLGLVVALVILVIFLFLRRVRATAIPALAVPISIIATFAGMYLLDFSIDNISLLALTLSVGLVVDDAIVMLENIVRYIEAGMKPMEAAFKGAREIGFTILSITLSLIAVFVPIFLMGGIVGRVFHEFGVVVAMAIGISAFVSLTLTPMMCARLLGRDDPERRPGLVERVLERGYDAMLGVYDVTLDWTLRHRRTLVLTFFATVALSLYLFREIPKGFFPTEDTGQLFISTEARQDISFPAMFALQREAMEIVLADPHVLTAASMAGSNGRSNAVNTGRMFINLVEREERPPIEVVARDLRTKLERIPGLKSFIQPVQNLRIGGRSSKSVYQYALQGADLAEVQDWAVRMTEALNEVPTLVDVTSDLQVNSPQARIRIDRDRAATLGITAQDIRSTLYGAFGARRVATIFTSSNDYAVIVELDPRFQRDASALSKIRVRAADGGLVPLDAIASVERTAGSLAVTHQDQLPAVTISFNTPLGISLGDAVDQVKRIEREIGLPATVTGTFSGTAQLFEQSQANVGLLLLGAVLSIYIVLGILYESYIHPLTILSGLPAAAAGALIALIAAGEEFSIIAAIGVLMLIGIVKKNGIMMIDFALAEQRENGTAPLDAIHRACLLRFRPIMMTTMAAVMGTLPIALGHGAGAELRQPLGIAVVGGLVVSQVLTLYITPVLYLYMESAGAQGRLFFARLRARVPETP